MLARAALDTGTFIILWASCEGNRKPNLKMASVQSEHQTFDINQPGFSVATQSSGVLEVRAESG